MKKKILVIDNDEAILDVITEALVYEGFEVIAISGTDDIIILVDKVKPDLAIIDYILPGSNGGELCYQIKSNERTSRLPVILFSAYPKVFLSPRYCDCDAFIPKPFDLSLLIGQIKNFTEPSVNFSK